MSDAMYWKYFFKTIDWSYEKTCQVLPEPEPNHVIGLLIFGNATLFVIIFVQCLQDMLKKFTTIN